MSGKTKSAEIATKGIRSAAQFADLMSALMSDLLDGSITPEVGHVVCKTAKNLLDVVEMSHRHKSGNFGIVFAPTVQPLSQTLPPAVAPALTADGNGSGKVKCNQCDDRVYPRDLAEHKRLHFAK